MKSIFVLGAIALSTTLSGVALAADAPAASPAPVAVDPLTAILTPIGDGLNVIVQPVLVAPVNAVTAVIAPPPPPPPAPAPVHHPRHHRHHHHL